MTAYLDQFCSECGTVIDEEDIYIQTIKEDHFPDDPHIPAETQQVKTYQCPNCGYSPFEN